MKLHIIGDEVRQSTIMLEGSANRPAAISAAVQDYLGIIWPNGSVMSRRAFNGEEGLCTPFLSP